MANQVYVEKYDRVMSTKDLSNEELLEGLKENGLFAPFYLEQIEENGDTAVIPQLVEIMETYNTNKHNAKVAANAALALDTLGYKSPEVQSWIDAVMNS